MNPVYIKIIPPQIPGASSCYYGTLDGTAQPSSTSLLTLFLLYSALRCHVKYNSEFYQDFTASLIRRSVHQLYLCPRTETRLRKKNTERCSFLGNIFPLLYTLIALESGDR